MNRRSAGVFFLALLKTALVSSLAQAAQQAAQEAARTLARISGPHWNVNGNWAPSLEEVQRHLQQTHGINPGNLSLDDLLTLHDNDHNRRGAMSTHSHNKKSPKSSTKGYAKF